MKKFLWYDTHIDVFNMGTNLNRGLYGKGLNNIDFVNSKSKSMSKLPNDYGKFDLSAKKL